MKRFWDLIFRQYDIGTWWGAIRVLWNSAMFYYSPVSMFMTVNIYYYAVRDKYLGEWFPWFNLKWFIVLLVLAIIIAMLTEYKITVPSLTHYSSAQAAKHKNPIFDEIRDIRKQQREMGKKIDSIEKQLKDRCEYY